MCHNDKNLGYRITSDGNKQNSYNGSDTIRPEWTELGRSEEAGVLVERVIPPALLVDAAAVAVLFIGVVVLLFVVFLFEYFLFVILFVGHNC